MPDNRLLVPTPAKIVAHPPPRPLLVFDGDCHFCRGWIARWRERTGDLVDYAPLQERAAAFPEAARAEFEREVKLIEPNGRMTGGAEAVFRTLALGRGAGGRALLWAYQRVPLVEPVADAGYAFVARHRTFASTMTRLLWGNDLTRPAYHTAQRWFLRTLALIYLCAFLSLGNQVDGLIGQDGILPARDFFAAAHERLGPWGVLSVPSLCWWNASDASLHFLCAGGVVLAALLLMDVAPALCLALLWVFYLSLCAAGQAFLSFQWDTLLLETGFLSIFLAPLTLHPFRRKPRFVSGGGSFLLRWLLFGLMLMSGVVKLTSGDSCWLDFTALHYHYETQPLPTWIGWYAHQAPAWFERVSMGFAYFAELIAPFLIFGPRRVRALGCAALVLFQILIAATGNYGFFNLLTLALCLLLVDDAQWPRRCVVDGTPGRRWPRWIVAPVAAVFVGFGALLIWSSFTRNARWPAPVMDVYERLEPFRTVNSYGLFRVMTRTRPEIVIEGSNDGENWRAYEFRWKPGDVQRAPRFVAPYMPRLDWQMWFAALGDYQENVWFMRLAERLLRGTPAVLALLADNPFPGAPPKYLRAQLYEYHFTSLAERRRTGAWWGRELQGAYSPAVSLRDSP